VGTLLKAVFCLHENGLKIFKVKWVSLVWVCDTPFDKNRGHKLAIGTLVWVCDTHDRHLVKG